MRIKRIIMDLDEVVVDFIEPLIAEYNRRYSSDITIEDITQWALPADMCAIFRERNFFINLIPYPESIRALELLRARGHEVIIATSPSGDPHIAEQKLTWCQDFLPGFPVVITERKDILKGDMMVDDCVEHLRNFDGIRVIMDRPWNRNEAVRGYRAWDWDEILYFVEWLESGQEGFLKGFLKGGG